jgi:signal peptidase I
MTVPTTPAPSVPATPPPAPEAGVRGWALDWLRSIGFALVVWLVLRTFVFEAFRIPSQSMENTLLIGDFLFANKAVYGAELPWVHWRLPGFREPTRGDVVIFDSVEEPGNKIVKRLVGIAGDTVEMRRGVLYRNGAALDEPYAVHATEPPSETPDRRSQMRSWQVAHFVGRDPDGYWPDLNDWGPLVVPIDSLFVMGDNRDSSYDGRYWGFLPRSNVVGTPMFIYYSYDGSGVHRFPFFTEIRWGRIFSVPR